MINHYFLLQNSDLGTPPNNHKILQTGLRLLDQEEINHVNPPIGKKQ